jgi:hypothetical protein
LLLTCSKSRQCVSVPFWPILTHCDNIRDLVKFGYPLSFSLCLPHVKYMRHNLDDNLGPPHVKNPPNLHQNGYVLALFRGVKSLRIIQPIIGLHPYNFHGWNPDGSIRKTMARRADIAPSRPLTGPRWSQRDRRHGNTWDSQPD